MESVGPQSTEVRAHTNRARALVPVCVRGTVARHSARWALTCGLLVSGACTEPETAAPCVGVCEDRDCGDDGCGFTCGSCAATESCSDEGQCVTAEPACESSCESVGAVCGEICGELCGECTGDQELCSAGACVCAPACEGLWCTEPDGCGGTCDPCPNERNCQDCVLQLQVIDQTVSAAGQVTDVTLGLDYVAEFSGGLATMADIRLRAEGPTALLDLEVGDAITNSGKDLQRDPDTGEPTLVLPDGTLRWVVFSTEDQTPLEAGRWLTMRFRMGAAFEPAQLPGVFTLRDDEVILTPAAAQSAVEGSGVTTPVVVWYEAVEETR